MFWKNYEYLCKTVGKSPNAVASDCGVKSSGSVTAWKVKGALPRQSTLDAIAAYFKVDVLDLISKDLSEKTKPALQESELDRYISLTLNDVLPDEVGKIEAFFAGLKASRKT